METINMKAGDIRNIQLKSLATSGYQWTFSIDKDEVVAIRDIAGKTDSQDLKPGQNTDQIFEAKALTSGTAHIHFSQQRSWEKGDPAHSADYTIIVTA